MGTDTLTEAQLAEEWTKIATSPRYFIEDTLGEKLDEQQIQVVEGFQDERLIAVTSGHSCGKDWISARLALWYHITHYPSIVVTTGPSDRQVKNIVWGEIRAAYHKSKLAIGGELMPESAKLRSGDPHHYMIGYTSGDADAFQGLHADHVLVLVTEAQGIDGRLWTAIKSLMTARGDAKLLAIGNPVCEPDSEFHAMSTRLSHLYKTYRLDSEKSSYCSVEWIKEMRDEFGEDSPMFQARVRGIFPDTIADTLIPLAWIYRAHERWKESAGAIVWKDAALGADIARFGSDHTVFYAGARDGRFVCVHDRQGQDLMATAGEIAAKIREGLDPRRVRLDDTGLGGGVTDRLKEQGKEVVAINFGSKPTDDAKFLNARSEIFWALRERFRSGDIAIDPGDRKLLRDLSVLRTKMTSKGQIKLEEKAEAKRRLGYSPDRADALALAALADATAHDLESGGIPSRGLLEFMRDRARSIKTPQGKEIAAKRPMTEVPGAAQMLGGGSGNVHP